MLSAKKELFTPSGGGYQISRSVRLRSISSAHFNRTVGTAGNRKTYTWSGWVKRSGFSTRQILLASYNGDENNTTEFGFDTSDKFFFSNVISSSQATGFYGVTSAVFRDPSAWYHIVFVVDTTQTTGTAALKLYINGVQQTLTVSYGGGTNHNTWVNAALPHRIGQTAPPNSSYFNGYLAEVNFVDGQALTPSSFGESNAITGVWQPKLYIGTYGTNGYYLNFNDNSAVTTSSNVGIGKDFSGNGNYWTSNSISVSAGVTYDSMIDVPTLYDDGTVYGRGNYPTLNPLDNQLILSNANLYAQENSGDTYGASRATMAIPTSGKWYWEHTIANAPTASSITVGLATSTAVLNGVLTGAATTASYNTRYATSRTIANGATLVRNDAAIAFTTNDIVQCAYDAATGKLWFGKNNAWFDTATGTTGNPSAGTNQIMTVALTGPLFPFVSSFLDNVSGVGGAASINFGQRPFTYTPPTGFKALNTQNLPDATIKKGNQYFDVVTSTATVSTGTSVSSLAFSPGLMWRKARSATESHYLVDAVRGTGSGGYLVSNSTAVAQDYPNLDGTLTFNSNGYTITDSNWNVGEFYFNGRTYVDWIWDAGNTTVTNTNGTITSQVRANPTAGFSVVTYTGNGVTAATVGHGLNAIPAMVIIKERGLAGTNWMVKHQNLATNINLILQTTGGNTNVTTSLGGGGIANLSSSTTFNFVAGTTNTDNVNRSAGTFVAYCFAEVAGYSKFGSYTGNGLADGTFIYTGFRPRWILIKSTTAARTWLIYDTAASNPYNMGSDGPLLPNSTDVTSYDGTGYTSFDILSNGFKLRVATANINASNETHIYAAFAENPFKHSLAR